MLTGYGLIFFVALQRLYELDVSRRSRAALESDGYSCFESAGRYSAMVAIHVAWLVCLIAEPLVYPRAVPWGVQSIALGVFAACQIGRVWVISTLGRHWNTSIMAKDRYGESDTAFVASGPYRFVRHPNYLIVVLEVLVVPVTLGAYVTAVTFSLLNGLFLVFRIKEEEKLLFGRPGYAEAMASKPRFLPFGASGKGFSRQYRH